MQINTLILALVGMSVAVEGSALRSRFSTRRELEARQGFPGFGAKNNGQNNGQANANAAKGSAAAKASTAAGKTGTNDNTNAKAGTGTLAAKSLQTGSQQDGSKDAGEGQKNSLTDDNNFINFCEGKLLTNGIQQKGGSCNGIPMGDIPATTKMASTIIISPQVGKEPAAKTDFDVVVQIANMDLGTFTNPASTYYSAPQQLSAAGTVIGHTHITIQDMKNNLNPTTPLDASTFAFFKGINDAGNGQGQLKTTVTGGLPDGTYRICTMAGASNHQPLLMPVAQRGAQDDCIRITIGNAAGAGGGAAAGAANNNNAAANKAAADKAAAAKAAAAKKTGGNN